MEYVHQPKAMANERSPRAIAHSSLIASLWLLIASLYERYLSGWVIVVCEILSACAIASFACFDFLLVFFLPFDPFFFLFFLFFFLYFTTLWRLLPLKAVARSGCIWSIWKYVDLCNESSSSGRPNGWPRWTLHSNFSTNFFHTCHAYRRHWLLSCYMYSVFTYLDLA